MRRAKTHVHACPVDRGACGAHERRRPVRSLRNLAAVAFEERKETFASNPIEPLRLCVWFRWQLSPAVG